MISREKGKLTAMALVMTSALMLGACGNNTAAGNAASPENQTSTDDQKDTVLDTANDDTTKDNMVVPQPVTLDVNNLNNVTFHASLTNESAYENEDGALVLTFKVYEPEYFNAADIEGLAVGDTIVVDQKSMLIDQLETDSYGILRINGGLDEEDGVNLRTDENGMYYVIGFDDYRNYIEVGSATLPVDQDFVFTDNSDEANQNNQMFAGDLFTVIPADTAGFGPNNTTIHVENDKVVSMERCFTP